MCVISNQNTTKKPHCVFDHSKPDALLHKLHIEILLVLRYQDWLDMYRSILSLSKKAHQMWRDHLYSQRNMRTERAMGLSNGTGGSS